MKINNNNQKSKKNIIIVATIIAAIIAYVLTAYVFHLPPFKTVSNVVSPEGYVTNFEKSKTEKAVTKSLEDNPDQKLENSQTDIPKTPDTTNNGKQQVNVLITNTGIYNNTVSASGMVTNISETGGTCTFAFTNGSNTISKTSNTLANPTSTSCTTVSFPASELTANGVWKVVLAYNSNNAVGVSSEKEFSK